MKKITLLFCFFLLSIKSFSQLAGTYTVGGSNPDYATLTDAASMLLAGVSDTVIFNIRPGTYNEMLHFNWVMGSPTTPIIFQSENLDSTSVILHFDTMNYGVINSGDYLTFKHLTIINNAEGGKSFLSTDHVFIENCLIKGIYLGNETYATDTRFYQNWWGSFHMRGGRLENTELTFDNAFFSYPYSNEDSLQIVNCRFNVPTVYASSLPPYALVSDNYFQGSLSFSSEGGELLNNEINGQLSTGVGSGSIKYNRVYGNSHISLSENGLACNNSFNGTVMCSGNSGKFLFNNLSHNSGGNTFFISGMYWQIWNNNLPDSVQDSYNTGTNIFGWNNYYPGGYHPYDLHPFSYDPQYIYFSPSELYAQNTELMGKGIYFSETGDDMYGWPRPYMPTIGANEICLTHTDTVTITCGDSLPLHLCNVPLNGNYTWIPSAGLNNPSIASPMASPANSTLYILTDAVSGFSDSVYINVIPYNIPVIEYTDRRCGDSIYIHVPFNANATYQWIPITGLTDPQASYTLATLYDTTTYTVNVNIPGCGSYTDSATVVVNPLPQTFYYYTTEGLTVTFDNQSTCADEYFWDFGDSTGTSTEENPVYTFTEPGSYVVKLTATNQAGFTYYEGIVNITILCSADFILYPDSVNQHQWYLIAQGIGTEPISYFWEWGDGFYSTETTPSHTYDTAGYYTICLTITDYNGCTATYCDSSTYIYKTGAEMVTVNVINQFNVGIEEEKEASNSLIYPNPTAGILTVETSIKKGTYLLSDITGKTLLQGTVATEKFTLDISTLSSGVYFITVTDGERQVNSKVIKE